VKCLKPSAKNTSNVRLFENDMNSMTRKICSFVCHVALVALAATSKTSVSAAEAESKAVDGKIRWIYNYAEGQKLAQQTGKPLFVVFRCER